MPADHRPGDPMGKTDGEIEVSAAASAAGRGSDCERARERIERFLGGTQGLAEDRALHTHLARCAECNQDYREQLDELVRMRRERRDPAHVSALEWGPSLSTKARKRANALRFLIPAVIVVAILVQLGPAPPIGEVIAIEGACQVGTAALDAGDPAQDVGAGEVLATSSDSIARLESHAGGSVLLAPSTRLFVQDAQPAQYLLTAGEVTVQGSCAVTTPLGAIEVQDGVARIALERGALEVESHRGQVTVLDARGEHRLAEGERVRLESGATAGL